MSTLDGSLRDLYDSDLLKKLNGLLNDVNNNLEYGELKLSFNKLSTLPDLRAFKKFDNLKVSDLCYNKIRDIDFSLIPPTLTELKLMHNKLTSIGSLNHCTELNCLSVSYNRITQVDWSNLPPALKWLYLDQNQLTTVGDVSHCTRLSVFSLSSNHINHIDWKNLPPSLTWLTLDNNLLSTAELIHCTQLEWLELGNNPTLHSIQSLPDHDFGFFGLSLSSNVKVLGRMCFHAKTYHSLKRACRKFNWKLEQPPLEVFMQGLWAVLEYNTEGSMITTHTSMMLLGPTTAGKSSMMKSLIDGRAVLVHIDDRTQVADIQTWYITSQDSVQLFDHGGHDIYRITSSIFIVPNSTIALVHDISQASEDKVQETTAILRHALAYHPKNQVHLVLTHTDLVSTDDAQKNRDLIKAKVHACIDEEVQSLTHPTEKDEDRSRLLAQLKKQKDNMEVFLLSSKTYEGMENFKEFITKVIAQKRVSLPEKWVQFYKLCIRSTNNKGFFKVAELEQLFKGLYVKPTHAFQQGKIQKKFRSALEYYRAAGHVLHFPDNPVLEDYVFHNKDFLLRLMQPCFHHSLKDSTNFEDLMQTMNASNIDVMLRQYDEEGLLAIELLQFLWRQYGLKEEEERAVLEIMKNFHICYPVDGSEKVWFFPYFVRNNEPPASLDLEKIHTINRQYFCVLLHCVFNNTVPVNAFEAMQVQVQKTAVEKKYGNSRYTWRDGIRVMIGALEIRAVRRASKSTISLCVSAPSNDVEHVWQVTLEVYSDLEAVLQPLLGVIKLIYFECTHCIVKHLQPVHKRSPSEVLKNKGPDVTYQCCRGDEIPRALVIAPSAAGSKRIEKQLKDVREYLQSTFREMSPPGKLLYLDCEEVGEHQFDLSWCWPACEEETGPLAETSHAVVEYRVGQQWTRLTDNIKKSPYRVECYAEEFKVAAANKNGCGEFSHITPVYVVQADEIISDTDKEKMVVNHMFFSRMTNIKEIIQRLVSRGVISETQKQKLVRLPHTEVADQLMEGVMLRSTYKQLYLFRKTLEETGQSVMAETVPVELERRNTASSGSVGGESAAHRPESERIEIDMSLPGKLLYLDCEEVCENQFHLSWGWPTCDGEAGTVTEITHAVAEYRMGEKWTRFPDNITRSPYKAECNAEEFKVAAVNKNGSGEFLYGTPFHIIQADEMISDTDRDHMKENHEFFTKMTHVQDILLRLFTRGVISDLVYDTLNGVENKADQLMKRVIYRSTYKQLYLFQKTLQETGQSLMAATVPVKLERKHAAPQGPMPRGNTCHQEESGTIIRPDVTDP